MNNFRYKFQQFKYKALTAMQRFMVGRYGPDNLYMFLTYVIFALLIINLFLKNKLFNIVLWVLIIINTIRPFSKNHQARYKENQLFIKTKNVVISWFNLTKKKMTDKEHVYRKCPHCSKTLRLPRKKGKHTVNCPNCHKEFEVKI